MIRRTSCIIKKKIFRGKFDSAKEAALYRRTTYWFLFAPVYSYDEFVD